ncbi:hypothetical protein V6N13_083300 [Hibiscus sabdariffa]
MQTFRHVDNTFLASVQGLTKVWKHKSIIIDTSDDPIFMHVIGETSSAVVAENRKGKEGHTVKNASADLVETMISVVLGPELELKSTIHVGKIDENVNDKPLVVLPES